jgi:hypothetical protein
MHSIAVGPGDQSGHGVREVGPHLLFTVAVIERGTGLFFCGDVWHAQQ